MAASKRPRAGVHGHRRIRTVPTCPAAAACIQVAVSTQQKALAVGSAVIQARHQVQGGVHEDRGLHALPARKGPQEGWLQRSAGQALSGAPRGSWTPELGVEVPGPRRTATTRDSARPGHPLPAHLPGTGTSIPACILALRAATGGVAGGRGRPRRRQLTRHGWRKTGHPQTGMQAAPSTVLSITTWPPSPKFTYSGLSGQRTCKERYQLSVGDEALRDRG